MFYTNNQNHKKKSCKILKTIEIIFDIDCIVHWHRPCCNYGTEEISTLALENTMIV